MKTFNPPQENWFPDAKGNYHYFTNRANINDPEDLEKGTWQKTKKGYVHKSYDKVQRENIKRYKKYYAPKSFWRKIYEWLFFT